MVLVFVFQSKMPGMEHVLEIDSDYLMFFTVTMLILALCVKVSAMVCLWYEWHVFCMNSVMEFDKYVQHVLVRFTSVFDGNTADLQASQSA